MFRIRNESGLAHLAAVVIIVLVAGLGFASWRIYSVQKENDKIKKTTLQTEVKKEDRKKETTVPEGFVEYRNEELGFKFAYPKDWEVVTLTENEVKEAGRVLGLVSPAQKKAFEEFAKSGRQSEGPMYSDLYVSYWKDINSYYTKIDGKYDGLEDLITHEGSSIRKTAEIKIGTLKAYEVSIGGIGESYGIMFQRTNKSVYQFDFINIWDKSKVDQTTTAIVNSIQLL